MNEFLVIGDLFYVKSVLGSPGANGYKEMHGVRCDFFSKIVILDKE